MKTSGHNGKRISGSGTYVLVLRMASRARVDIGKLGRFDLKPGYYCYVGSGFGPGGVLSRLAHHFRPVKHPRWHVDYLRTVASVEEAWYGAHAQKQEHGWAAILGGMSNASIAIPRFGSSDCACPGHLLYFRARPTSGEFARLLKRVSNLTRLGGGLSLRKEAIRAS